MKKILKRVLAGAVLTSIISFVAIAILIINPQILFAVDKAYGDFTIYSNNEIPESYKTTIDEAIELIGTSEIYEPNHKLHIFISHGSLFNELETKIFGYAVARCTYNNIILKAEVDFNKNMLLIGNNSKRDLIKTIAHEAIHFYQMKKSGILNFNPINHPPQWKMEGYPEYVAYQKDIRSGDYDIRDSINKLIEFEKTGEYLFETSPGQFEPFVYYKGRIMIEYLIDIKGLTYTEILNETVVDEKVIEEMTIWYERP